MERLTPSPYVVDMYSYCGMSVIQEYAGVELSKVVDKLQPLEKLKVAKQVSQGVADMHKAGIVHNDLNFANVAFTNRKEVPVLNDFNLGILVLKNNETKKDCTFTHHFPNPQWRSPEEQMDIETQSPVLTNKIDIYALGNILFRFATGRTPWKIEKQPRLTPEQKEEVSMLKRNGTLPPLIFPGRFGKQRDDPATEALLDIMKQCYLLEPAKRPNAIQVVNRLQRAFHNITHSQQFHKKTVHAM